MTATRETSPSAPRQQPTPAGLVPRLVAAWSIVGIPLAYGVYETVKKASALF